MKTIKAAKRRQRKYTVVIAQTPIVLPGRTQPEPWTREYGVFASSRKAAIKAVRDAGHSGRVVEVIAHPLGRKP